MPSTWHGDQELELLGGTANRGLVRRVGDTVRRPRPTAGTGVQALLEHLERVGFDGAPRYLGQDENGRDVLSYVEGEVPIAPHPAWALTDEALISVAALLGRYHDAARSFDPAPYEWPTTVPSPYRGALVTHNDPNLDNVVFRDGRAVALIDFDLASPGSPLWDAALAARLWVPLRNPQDVPDGLASRAGHRLRLFAESFGLTRPQRERLAAAILATHTWCYDIIRAGVEQGRPGYQHYWTPSAQAHDARGRQWLEDNLGSLATALLAPG
jgi:Ser/Thr protein kinase RdoA (MazF antagonist)